MDYNTATVFDNGLDDDYFMELNSFISPKKVNFRDELIIKK